jgi:AcrR family transcriptional regulator
MTVQATRERIIEATTALFMERGFAGSGLKQIATASSAPVGSIYHSFPGGKAELAAETLRSSGRAYMALVGAVLDAAPDIITGVADCFNGAAAVLRATDYADACPIATVALEVASSDEALRQVTAEVFASWHDALITRLTGAGVASAQAGELATMFVASLEGGFLLSRAAKDTSALETIGRVMVELVATAVST